MLQIDSSVKLNSGYMMPLLGLGFLVHSSISSIEPSFRPRRTVSVLSMLLSRTVIVSSIRLLLTEIRRLSVERSRDALRKEL